MSAGCRGGAVGTGRGTITALDQSEVSAGSIGLGRCVDSRVVGTASGVRNICGSSARSVSRAGVQAVLDARISLSLSGKGKNSSLVAVSVLDQILD